MTKALIFRDKYALHRVRGRKTFPKAESDREGIEPRLPMASNRFCAISLQGTLQESLQESRGGREQANSAIARQTGTLAKPVQDLCKVRESLVTGPYSIMACRNSLIASA